MHEFLIHEAHVGDLMRYFGVVETLDILHEHFY
jgi:hypothetical protein